MINLDLLFFTEATRVLDHKNKKKYSKLLSKLKAKTYKDCYCP